LPRFTSESETRNDVLKHYTRNLVPHSATAGKWADSVSLRAGRPGRAPILIPTVPTNVETLCAMTKKFYHMSFQSAVAENPSSPIIVGQAAPSLRAATS